MILQPGEEVSRGPVAYSFSFCAREPGGGVVGVGSLGFGGGGGGGGWKRLDHRSKQRGKIVIEIGRG